MTSRQSFSPDAVVSAAKTQVSSSLEGEAVILDLQSGRYLGLEAVGARIWELLQEPVAVGEIEERILAEYEVEPERCRADLEELLHSLHEQGLVEIREP